MFMKRKLLLLLAGFAWFSSQGQLVNDGATIVIQPGATLFVESNFQNVSGTLNNQGTMEVMGDFSNDAGSSITNGGLIKFTGSTSPSMVMSSGAALNNVQINKAGQNVILQDAMTINGSLSFGGTSGPRLILGSNNLVLGSAATTTGATAATGYVDASGSGNMTKQFSSPELFNFPVGDDNEFSPLEWTPGVGASGAGNVSVGVVDQTHPNKPAVITTDYLSRYWKVTSTTYPSALKGTFTLADVNGTASKIKGASYVSPTWTYAAAGNGMNFVTGNSNAGTFDFTGLATIGTVKIKAYLAGAFNTGTGMMTTSLNSLGLIPLPSPYLQNPVSVGSIPNSNITDWVLLEVTNPNNLSDPAIYKSAFVLKTGNIVDLDGSSDPQIVGAYNPAFIRVLHRNHLSIRTLNGIDTQSPIEQNFTDNTAGIYINPGSIGTNNPMVSLGSGIWGLWGGNGNGNTQVNYGPFGSDRIALLSNPNTIGILTRGLGNNQSGSISNVYGNNDFNMNGTINYGPFGSDRIFLLSNSLGNNQSKVINQH